MVVATICMISHLMLVVVEYWMGFANVDIDGAGDYVAKTLTILSLYVPVVSLNLMILYGVVTYQPWNPSDELFVTPSMEATT